MKDLVSVEKLREMTMEEIAKKYSPIDRAIIATQLIEMEEFDLLDKVIPTPDFNVEVIKDKKEREG